MNNNKVANKNNLITHINSLNDNIQFITDCRNTLLQSKMDIEKSLNGIMFNLMTCEYNLVDKIEDLKEKSIKDSTRLNVLFCCLFNQKKDFNKLKCIESTLYPYWNNLYIQECFIKGSNQNIPNIIKNII